MAFKSYLTRQYEHTHENSFFRAVSTQLRKAFGQQDGLNILLGNISCNGHQIDSIFISKGKIIVIDFKNYGGKLTFSENNPWQIHNGKDFVFVKGGGGIRNPFQQVNAYRHSLIQFLSNKQKEILEPNHDSLNFGHISTLVLFHQPVTFDENDIPQNINKYFGIADNNNCIATIADRASNQLNFSDSEINNILTVLDIKEENLFDEKNEPETNNQPTEIPNAAERLELVRKVLANVDPHTELEKLLLYYQTLINLERQKEPTVQDEHPFHINWSSVSDSISINLENSPEFHVRFQQNQQQQFPKNVFIGINIILNTHSLPLLYNVVSHRDILSHTAVESNISDFTLYTKPLEDRNYPDELIEELASAVNQKNTITEKLEILRHYLEGIVELVENVTVAFSEENPFTSQLLSELKKINQDGLVKTGSTLEKFLFKKAFTVNANRYKAEDFIQITALNKNQKEAVRLAFNQPLSVITGPPGTGKTQVVLNILANALVFNKKVLLASKNNQAVDNVKERLSAIIKEPDFFLRFGSKTEIRDKTRPTIESYVRRIHNRLVEDNSEQLNEIKIKIAENWDFINKSVAKIERKKYLETEIPNLEVILNNTKTEYGSWLNGEMSDLISVFKTKTTTELNTIFKELVTNKNDVVSKYVGLNKFIFDFTQKRKYAAKLLSSFESLLPDLKELAIKRDVSPSIEKSINGSSIIKQYENLIKFIEDGIHVLYKISEFEKSKLKAEDNLKNTEFEIEQTKLSEKELLTKIADLKIQNNSLGVPMLNELIHSKLSKTNEAQINRYKDYIPDNIPWRSQDIPEFIETTSDFLNTFNMTAITSLSIKSAFPLSDELFDIVVIDEASQCDIASALPLVLRAKQLVVIGDPMQLKHISKVQSYEEKYIVNKLKIDTNLRLDYVNESLYDYCYNLSITSKSQSVFLKEHFRCHPQIIGYSNKAFYGPKMGQELEIATTNEQYKIDPKGIYWINVDGSHHQQRNINKKEQDKVIDLALKLADKHKDATIGITTPFNHQAKDLNEAIPNTYRSRIKADTVHRFQGDEKDIMILSLVISSDSPKYKAEWINNKVPFLINVAVTRAKNSLYIIGNAKYCRTLPNNSPLGQLVKYVDDINPIQM